MNKFTKTANKYIGKAINRFTSVTAQKTGEKGENFTVSEEIKALCRAAGAEGAVLLKNENGALPLKSGETLSLFGRVQSDFFFVGYGSGGDVNAPYRVGPVAALKNAGVKLNETLLAIYDEKRAKDPVNDGYWGHWPMSYDEIALSEKVITDAAAVSDKAVVFIGRSSGEDRELKLEKGSYYLADEEKRLIGNVSRAFGSVILVLNCGSIMDMEEICAYGDKISAILYIWQSGMESGNALADVLTGKVSPGGKLADTIAATYADYPGSAHFGDKKENLYVEDIFVGYRYFETFAKDKVLYPFGFGLSYTTFEVADIACSVPDMIEVTAEIRNTGEYTGKEVLQVYYEAPGETGSPARVLAGFAKTGDIAPGSGEKVSVRFAPSSMAYYDENESAYVLAAGKYNIRAGTDVRSAVKIGEYEVSEKTVTEKLSQCGAPVKSFEIMKNACGKPVFEKVNTSRKNLREHILNNLPSDSEYTGDKGYKLIDVKEGRVTIDDFAAQLDNDELEALSRGDFKMNSPLGASGNAGAFAGVLKSLRDKGVPPVITTDGPSGIRLHATSSLLPIGVCLACTFNDKLIEQIYTEIGKEMAERGSDVLLAPGMNIHRNPLCGRNFEYFSEDPLLTGRCGAAVVRGVQKHGLSACPKHFACNSQETARTHEDSVLSERALREIYLKGFEICVKEAKPNTLMTSYNKINGVWGHYNYELVTDILRGEWGFEGTVITDWWMRSSASPEFSSLRDQAYRVRAGVNVLMPGGARAGKYSKKPDGTLLETLGRKDGITRGELIGNAKTVLSLAMKKL
ncbi:MAG: glycoside hydrolase family 3 C-terminal domain-containing protein [Clostridia bacterium]|nr:glycoside hydrolase family 3 C-terminal domain-containing protein [Clostridia bacterium]